MPTSDVTPYGLATASCIKENGVILGGDILVIRMPLNTLDGLFLSYSISNNREEIMKLVSGSTVYHLYGSDMKKFEVNFPKIEEQTRIATILSDMDTELTTLETRLSKAKSIKQGMMQQLLTGKIRLI
jgi:type I restriction enzyme S subunit